MKNLNIIAIIIVSLIVLSFVFQKKERLSEQFPDKNVFIIGGKQLYEATESIVDRIYLTRMKGQYFADTRIDLEQYLSNFRIMTARPGRGCTHEIWIRTSS